jgi:KUP system potassium uptake protein
LLTSYFWLKRLAISDEKAFGLDKSDVSIENVPMVYAPVSSIELNRK